MRRVHVHPAPAPAPKTPKIMQPYPYGIVSALSEPNLLDAAPRQKKLRRLPHIFAKVIELPFDSDTDVFVQETSDSFRFVVGAVAHLGATLTPHLVEIYQGVTKLVMITDNNDVSAIGFGGLTELDMWRFRLPASTRPDLATAHYCNGNLVVIVPKDNSDGNNIIGEQQACRADGGNGAGAGRLVLAL